MPCRALAGFEPVGHGLFGCARLGEVMRDQFGIRLDGVGKPGFQELRHLQVILLPGAFQERLVGGILNQGVLEDVLGPWRAAALIEQFRLDQLPETLA